MNQSPLSINIKPRKVLDWTGAKTFLSALNPTITVVGVDNHDDFHLIVEAQRAAPNTKIIARFIDEIHDGAMHLKPQAPGDTRQYIVSPQDQLSRIRNYGRDGLTAYFGNEPNTNASPDDLRRLANHTCEAMDLAASREYDMSLCILNLGVGHPKPIDGYLPIWVNPILLKLNSHRNRHYYGLHTYLPGDITEHLNALKKTCLERLHIPLPRIIITETGYDAVGADMRGGFKNRSISNEVYARRCIQLRKEDLRSWIDSGDVLGFAVFIYGDDDSWWGYNIETAGKGEVSTAWRDTVLSAYKAGELDMPIVTNDTERLFRVALPSNVASVYLTPSLTDKVIGTIPNNAIIQMQNKVKIGAETWQQIKSPLFNGWGWLPLKGEAVKFTEISEPPIESGEPPPPPALPVPPMETYIKIMPINITAAAVPMWEQVASYLDNEIQVLQARAAMIRAAISKAVTP